MDAYNEIAGKVEMKSIISDKSKNYEDINAEIK